MGAAVVVCGEVEQALNDVMFMVVIIQAPNPRLPRHHPKLRGRRAQDSASPAGVSAGVVEGPTNREVHAERHRLGHNVLECA